MPIIKPYFGIMRICNGSAPSSYIYHKTYANDRYNLVHAYKIIENDLKKTFEFIEPSENNQTTFSHRLYELFIRCATEFETNCKQVLVANGYSKKSMNIEDYFKINNATKLSKYEVKLDLWHPTSNIIKPFIEWEKSHSLSWYKDYNDVKHDRSKKFELASLSNVLSAASALVAILFAQFETEVFDAYKDSYGYSKDEDGFYYNDNNLFGVKPFTAWEDCDIYSFSSGDIKESEESFQKYPF